MVCNTLSSILTPKAEEDIVVPLWGRWRWTFGTHKSLWKYAGKNWTTIMRCMTWKKHMDFYLKKVLKEERNKRDGHGWKWDLTNVGTCSSYCKAQKPRELAAGTMRDSAPILQLPVKKK